MRCKSLLAAFVLALALNAQTLPTGVQKKASLGGITQYDFPNGLRVLLYPDPANPKITVNVVYLVGSRHEGYGETGMAHLLEHMDFIETTNGREIKKEIVGRGAQWNGTTSYDRTNYFETFTASDDNLKWALGLEADRMSKVKFTRQLLDTEMTVVRNEFERGENSPQSILEERVVSTAYLWHNYGKSTIGAREDIEKVPVERLEAFYHKYYRPDNAVLVVTGRIDETKTLSFVGDTIGKLPRPATKLEQTYTVEPVQDGERFVELRRVGSGQEVMMAFHAPAAGHPDAAALQVLSAIMNGGGGGGRGGRGGGGGGGQGRLPKALVETKLALSANMRFQALHDPGFVLVSANLSNEQSLDLVRNTLIKTVEDAVAQPPTREEVERVKTQMLRGLEQMLSDAQSLGTSGLTSAVAQGDWRLMFLAHSRLKDVSPEDVVRVAKTYFKASNRTVGYYIPTAEPDRTVVPTTPDLEAILKDYKTDVKITRGESFDPTSANIESRVVRSKLANGMKLALLPKESANGNVSGAIELHFGDQQSLAGKASVAQFAGGLMGRATKSKTREQLSAEMEKLNARITVSGGGGGGFGGRGGRGGFGGGGVSGASATINVPAQNFAAGLKLAVEMLREPAYTEAEFDRMRDQRLAALGQGRTEPAQLATEALNRHLSPYSIDDPRYNGTPEEQIAEIKQVTLADVQKFHDQFYGASHGEFAVVGPIDPAAVQKAAADLLGNWNASAPYQPLVAAYKKAEALSRKIETPDKANAQFEAGLRLQMTETDPDYPAMVLANYMFGGSITARMPDRIRNREGLSYSVSSRFTVPSEGDAALFAASAISNPANTPKVEASFRDELARTLRDGFRADEVTAARKAYLDARLVARSQDQALLTLLASHEQLGRTMKWDEDLERKIQALTPDAINAAFRRHIDPVAISIVKAGDFKTAGAYQ